MAAGKVTDAMQVLNQRTLYSSIVALGLVRLGGKRQLRWEAGVIFGVDSKSPDTTLRFLLEFEF